jgi:hypothetical protein
MKLAEIGRYQSVGDWGYILLGILITDIIVLFLTRFYPDFFGKALNRWYDEFKLSAVISDVFIIAIGFALTRYVYTWMTDPKAPFNIPLFIGLLFNCHKLFELFERFISFRIHLHGYNLEKRIKFQVLLPVMFGSYIFIFQVYLNTSFQLINILHLLNQIVRFDISFI